jgi:hypothetical protein
MLCSTHACPSQWPSLGAFIVQEGHERFANRPFLANLEAAARRYESRSLPSMRCRFFDQSCNLLRPGDVDRVAGGVDAGDFHSEIIHLSYHRLYIDNRSSIDCFDWADQEPVLSDSPHSHAMKAQRVRPVSRSRPEDTSKWTVPVRARVNFQCFVAALVHPGHKDCVITDLQAVKGRGRERTYFKPGVGGTLRTLFRRFRAGLEDGSDCANRTEPRKFAALHG